MSESTGWRPTPLDGTRRQMVVTFASDGASTSCHVRMVDGGMVSKQEVVTLLARVLSPATPAERFGLCVQAMSLLATTGPAPEGDHRIDPDEPGHA